MLQLQKKILAIHTELKYQELRHQLEFLDNKKGTGEKNHPSPDKQLQHFY